VRTFDLKELKARKELLVAESEIRRETLKLEIQNLQLYASGIKQKLGVFRSSRPLFLLSSLAGFFLGSPRAQQAARKKRRNRLARLVMGGLFGLRLYRRLRPLLSFFLSRRFGRNGAEAVSEEEEEEASTANM